MKPSFLTLFLSFLKIGALLLGGGYVIVPLLNSELSEKHKWVTKEEITDFYALGQCIPGIIAVNTTLFVGYKLRGKFGAITAFFGLIIPPFFAIILLASLLFKFTENTVANNVFWGVNIAIIILLYMTVKEIWPASIKDKFTFFLFILMLSLAISGVSPSIIILSSALFGILYKKITQGEAK